MFADEGILFLLLFSVILGTFNLYLAFFGLINKELLFMGENLLLFKVFSLKSFADSLKNKLFFVLNISLSFILDSLNGDYNLNFFILLPLSFKSL